MLLFVKDRQAAAALVEGGEWSINAANILSVRWTNMSVVTLCMYHIMIYRMNAATAAVNAIIAADSRTSFCSEVFPDHPRQSTTTQW